VNPERDTKRVVLINSEDLSRKKNFTRHNAVTTESMAPLLSVVKNNTH